MQERIQAEIELLRKKYPGVQHGDNWVLLPAIDLPPGRFNKETARALFTLPVGYPNTGPDNFFTEIDLRLKDGTNPPAFNPGSQSSSGPAPIAGEWGWFSWHPQAWRPSADIGGGDNLLTFVRSVNMCFRGEESQ